MHRAQKWICDEAVMWWAAYICNKPAPPQLCGSLYVHVSICMANSHTGGCMWLQGLIRDTDSGSLRCFSRPCSVHPSFFVFIPASWLGSILFPAISASLSLLWPCGHPPPIPSTVHSISQHCSSKHYFLVLLFLFSFAQRKNSSSHLCFFHTDWFELIEFNLRDHRVLAPCCASPEKATASRNSLVSLFLIAQWHKYQLEGLMYDERAYSSAWLLCVVISFPKGMFLHFVSRQNCVKLLK